MKLSIIKEDGTVYVDGVPKHVDLSSIEPADFRALQWSGPDTGKGGIGHIEFTGTPVKLNQDIVDLGDYYAIYQQWLVAPSIPKPFENLIIP